MIRGVAIGAGAVGGLAVLSGCTPLFGQAPAPPPVIVNTTGSDSGTTVLLAVAAMGFVGILLVAVALGFWGYTQYRRRQDAEAIARPLLAAHGVRSGSVIEGVVVRPELVSGLTGMNSARVSANRVDV